MELKRYYTTIDAHVGGEPLRIINGGLPPMKGNTILERRDYFSKHFDHIRKVLMHEPRGHQGMYGCILTPPVSEDADLAVLFMHNEGFSTMCGHGVIGIVTVAIEMGFLPAATERKKVVIDSPAGKVTAYAECAGSEVLSVSFQNVPSYVLAHDVPVSALGRQFQVDIAFGGVFYAIVHAEDLGVTTEIEDLPKLKRWGTAIMEEIERQMTVRHPLEPELHGIYGVIISDQARRGQSDLRNVTVFANGQIDRSPCATGTSARMATLYARGELPVGRDFTHESITGSQFVGRILDTCKVGDYEAIVTKIKGRAFITGTHQFLVDPSDPLGDGFLLK